MSQNRAKILDMLAKGKISPEEAERLLDKIDNTEADGAREGGSMEPAGPDASADAQKHAASAFASAKGSAQASAAARGSGKASASSFAAGGYSSGGGKAVYGQSVQTSTSSSMVEETREIRLDHVIGKPLHVRTVNGTVRVARSDERDVSITAIVKCESEERLKQTRIDTDRKPDGSLSIGVQWPGGKPRGSEGCDFEIWIPDAVGIDIGTANGLISVSEMAGEAALDSSNGAISVRAQAGSVKARTVNGSIGLEDVGGDAVAHTSNGKIGIANASGSVEAITQNAKVDLTLVVGNAGPFRVRTTNGAIRLSLGSGFNGELELGTSNAKVKLEDSSRVEVLSKDRSSAVLQVGRGGEKSFAKTSNSAIRVAFED